MEYIDFFALPHKIFNIYVLTIHAEVHILVKPLIKMISEILSGIVRIRTLAGI